MDIKQFEVIHSTLIRMEKKQSEMAQDIIIIQDNVKALNGKTLVVCDVTTRLNDLEGELKNIKDEVIA